MKFNILLIILLGTMVTHCASAGSKSGQSNDSINIEKKSGFSPNTKRIATLSLYHSGKKKLGDKSDLILNTYAAVVDGKMGEIFGEGMVGGDAIKTLATKLKLKNFEDAVQNLVESQLEGKEFSPDAKKTLSTITEKGRIDALAVPVANDGFESLSRGGKINISIIVFNGKANDVSVLAQAKDISADPADVQLAGTKPDQARANMNLAVIKKADDLLNLLKKEIKEPGPQVAKPDQTPSKKESETAKTEQTEEKKEAAPKEPEALSAFDEWLVSKVKVGLGPIMMGLTGLLFILL